MTTRNILLVMTVLGLFCQYGNAVSSGRLPFAACLVELPWGCPPDQFLNNDRLNCSVGLQRGNLMPWATAPVPTSDITVTAEIEGNPVDKYISGGELLDIKVRVSKISLYWRGILMYAVDAQGQKVGTWKLTAGAPYLVDRNMCGNATLLHSRATEKSTTEIFRFVTPPVGTGPITLKILVKTGPANTGAFFLPAPLNLGEFGPEPVQTGTLRWVRAATNQTCTRACQLFRVNNTATQCDDRYFSNFNTASDLGLNLRNFGHVCNSPRVLQCTNIGPAANPTTDTCVYTSSPQCTSLGKTAQVVTCASASPTLQRYCPCNTAQGLAAPPEIPTLFVPPVDPITEPPTASPASSLQASKLWLVVLSAFLGLFGSRKQQFLFALVVVIALAASPVKAHNWLNMPSRSFGQAEQIFPCPPREQLTPHVQVRVGNDFQVEWVTGHDRFTYWTLVKAGDEDKLKTLSEANMDDYLNSSNGTADGMCGPRGTITDPKYFKYHRVARNSTDNNNRNGFFPGFYQRIVPQTDPLFVPRPTADIGGFLSPTGYSNGSAFFQCEFRAGNRSRDRRAEYFNPKYPFVLSMAKFEHVTEQPGQPDFTLLRIPTNAPPGSYIAWWRWSGYYDCVDVDVLPAGPQVSHLLTHGVVPFQANSSFLKVDHSIVKPIWIKSLGDFTKSNTSFGCTLIRPGTEAADLAQCKTRCNRQRIGNNRNTECAGVVVAPLSLPSVSPFSTDDIEIPWDFASKLDNQRRNQCPRSLIANAPPGTRICYPVSPFGVTEAPTSAPMLTSTEDPENPIFYSSFYIRSTQRVFTAGVTNFVQPLPPFNFGKSCGVCVERIFGLQSNQVSPIWALADICRNCDDPFWGGQ